MFGYHSINRLATDRYEKIVKTNYWKKLKEESPTADILGEAMESYK